MNAFKAYFSSRSLPQLAAILSTIICAGVVLAALIMHSSDWMSWSFSSLGETKAPSALVFNLSLVLTAILIWRIGDLLLEDLKQLHVITAARLSSLAFKGIAVCLVGIALFPNDTWHAMHLVFARSMVVIFLFYMISLPHSLPHLSRRGKLLAYSMPVAAIIVSLQGFFYQDISFVLFEVLLGILALGWIYVLCRLVSKRANPKKRAVSVDR